MSFPLHTTDRDRDRVSCVKWDRHNSVGKMYLAADVVGGLSKRTTNINEKIFEDDRLVAMAYLRDTKAMAADLQGYGETIDRDTSSAETAILVAIAGRVLTTMESGMLKSLWRMRQLRSAPVAVYYWDIRLRLGLRLRVAAD